VTTEHRDAIYRIGPDDSLVFVNDEWDALATDNDSPRLTRDPILRKSIWEYIRDPDTVHIFRLLQARVRERNVALKLPFRCDAPRLRRFMEMILAPRPKGTD